VSEAIEKEKTGGVRAALLIRREKIPGDNETHSHQAALDLQKRHDRKSNPRKSGLLLARGFWYGRSGRSSNVYLAPKEGFQLPMREKTPLAKVGQKASVQMYRFRVPKEPRRGGEGFHLRRFQVQPVGKSGDYRGKE